MKKIIIAIIWIMFCNSCSKTEHKKDVYQTIFDTTKFVGKHPSKVAVLGTFHFATQEIHDYEEKHQLNILSNKKQEEIQQIIHKISDFKPTKILIERDRIKFDSLIQAQYTAYLNDDFVVNDKVDEVYQIAFRLGKLLSHKKIFCSDASADWFGADLDWGNFDEEAYLKEKQQYEKSNRYNYFEVYEVEDSLKSVLPLIDYYQLINSNTNALYNHQIYLTETALSGAGDNYIGADAVGRWYRRNLRIFSNVLDITDFQKEERLLMIYGASHIWTLQQLFKDSPDFEYIPMNDVLED